MVRLMVCLDTSEDTPKVTLIQPPSPPSSSFLTLLLSARSSNTAWKWYLPQHRLLLTTNKRNKEYVVQVGRGKVEEHHVVLAGVAEVYSRSNVLNVLRVDFDVQILDKANKSIVKGTRGTYLAVAESACSLAHPRMRPQRCWRITGTSSPGVG
jgi:hypothetical protein